MSKKEPCPPKQLLLAHPAELAALAKATPRAPKIDSLHPHMELIMAFGWEPGEADENQTRNGPIGRESDENQTRIGRESDERKVSKTPGFSQYHTAENQTRIGRESDENRTRIRRGTSTACIPCARKSTHRTRIGRETDENRTRSGLESSLNSLDTNR